MKNLGFAVISLGFIVATFATSLDPRQVDWPVFLGGLIASVVGVVLARSATDKAARSEERISENVSVIRESIVRIVEVTARLDAEKDDMDPYAVGAVIDDEVREDLDLFAAARETIAHVHGLQAYADVMSHFATGERYLNRVWSSGADGYIDEVRTYLGKAHQQFREVRAKLDHLAATAERAPIEA